MPLTAFLAFTAALLCSVLGLGTLYRRPRALVPRAFALGMFGLALRELLVGLGAQVTSPLPAQRWQQLGWLVGTMLPGSWLPFSLSFARSNYRDFLVRWKWLVISALVLPGITAGLFRQTFFLPPVALDDGLPSVLALSQAGTALGIASLLMAVAVLVHLEASLRAATGRKRWQIKFMVLGVASVFGVFIYTTNQMMLFATVTPGLHRLNSVSVLLAALLISISLLRHQLGSTHVTLSPTTLASSLTVLLVGAYLLVVGVLAKVISVLGSHDWLPLSAFFVFMALLGLAMVLLSEARRQRFRYFLSRHVYQTRHDYRHGWMTFNERTLSAVDVTTLCTVVTSIVSDMLVMPEVTIWLWQAEGPRQLHCEGSTVFSDEHAAPPGLTAAEMAALGAYLQQCQFPVDLAEAPDGQGQALWQASAEALQRAAIRYAVPLRAGGEFLGIMTLHGEWREEPLNLEDLQVLKVMAEQTATSIFNLQLLQQRARAQQLEALHTLSAFFVHDLKNLASNLSMTLQNLPVHYDNPAFREDVLRLMADSVAKIDTMRGNLALLSQPLELHYVEADLNELVCAALATLRLGLAVVLHTDLHPLARLSLDPVQIEKVVLNLLVNAQEAVGHEGAICVSTEALSGWAVLTVSDNGCGMSQEFITQRLFQPFQTTKRQGLGIGLFQSKMIIEAHKGRIEVESTPGKGTTFQVLLRC